MILICVTLQLTYVPCLVAVIGPIQFVSRSRARALAAFQTYVLVPSRLARER